MDIKEPTDVGKIKYLEGGGWYIANGRDMEVPCTCTNECTYDCKGECGCEACRQAYQDFGFN